MTFPQILRPWVPQITRVGQGLLTPDAVTFTAPCPACGHDRTWTARTPPTPGDDCACTREDTPA